MSIKLFSRGKGKSAVAAAAYRAGAQITNERDGITHDYTHKGGVVHTEILLPDYALAEYADRATLWNAVEKVEKAKNAQLAREIEIALPVELTQEQNISLVREYVKQHFVAAGMCADICIHDIGGGNPHAHVMLTLRPFLEGGKWGTKQKKEYILDPQGNKIYARKSGNINAILSPPLIGTSKPKRKNGAAASQMEKHGIATKRGNLNREIEVTNQRLRQLKARISKLQNWLKEEQQSTAPTTLADYIQSILSRKAQAGKSSVSQSIYNLKDASKMLKFLTANNIMDKVGLDEKFSSMLDEQMDIRDKLKPIERRLPFLKKNIEQADIYFKLKGKRALNEADQILFTAAHTYLKGVMNGHTSLPIKAWKTEYAKLNADHKTLNGRYLALKDEVHEAEQIRKSVYSILQQEQREQEPRKVQNVEL